MRTQVATRTEKRYRVIGLGQPDFLKVCLPLRATYRRTHRIQYGRSVATERSERLYDLSGYFALCIRRPEPFILDPNKTR